MKEKVIGHMRFTDLWNILLYNGLFFRSKKLYLKKTGSQSVESYIREISKHSTKETSKLGKKTRS